METKIDEPYHFLANFSDLNFASYVLFTGADLGEGAGGAHPPPPPR